MQLEPVFTDDKVYIAMLYELVNRSAAILRPSNSEAKRAELTAEYDKLNSEMERYRRNKCIEKYPDLKRVYKELGYEFDEPENANDVPFWEGSEEISVGENPFEEVKTDDDYLDL